VPYPNKIAENVPSVPFRPFPFVHNAFISIFLFLKISSILSNPTLPQTLDLRQLATHRLNSRAHSNNPIVILDSDFAPILAYTYRVRLAVRTEGCTLEGLACVTSLSLPSPYPLSPLIATLMAISVSVANKRLTVYLNPLDATLTKTRGWGPVMVNQPPCERYQSVTTCPERGRDWSDSRISGSKDLCGYFSVQNQGGKSRLWREIGGIKKSTCESTSEGD